MVADNDEFINLDELAANIDQADPATEAGRAVLSESIDILGDFIETQEVILKPYLQNLLSNAPLSLPKVKFLRNAMGTCTAGMICSCYISLHLLREDPTSYFDMAIAVLSAIGTVITGYLTYRAHQNIQRNIDVNNALREAIEGTNIELQDLERTRELFQSAGRKLAQHRQSSSGSSGSDAPQISEMIAIGVGSRPPSRGRALACFTR